MSNDDQDDATTLAGLYEGQLDAVLEAWNDACDLNQMRLCRGACGGITGKETSSG